MDIEPSRHRSLRHLGYLSGFIPRRRSWRCGDAHINAGARQFLGTHLCSDAQTQATRRAPRRWPRHCRPVRSV